MPELKRSLTAIVIIFCLCFSRQAIAQKLIPPPFVLKEWEKEYQPFRIVGNLYYVGTYDLACYLITTSQGNILINTGLAESVGPIKSNIESLGFKFSDIKILLATHAHFDHVAGMADIKAMTGAKMMIHEKDAQALADGGNSDFIFGGKGSTFKPVKADNLLRDNDTVRFGDMKIVVLNHPGHTQGANSFLFEVRDENKNYRVLIANMPTMQDQTNLAGMKGYPNIAKDYAYTFDALKKLKFDIWLSSHAAQFRLHQKHKPGDGYNPGAFIDQAGYDATVGNLERLYLLRLSPSINIAWERKTATINGVHFTKTSTMADVKKLLGNESRMLSKENTSTRLYIYDSLGINFIAEGATGIINKIDIYFLKGRREFEMSPTSLFKGVLSINGQPLQLTDSIEFLKTKTGLPFEEMVPGFYWYTATKEEFSLTIGYRDKKKERISTAIIVLNSTEEE